MARTLSLSTPVNGGGVIYVWATHFMDKDGRSRTWELDLMHRTWLLMPCLDSEFLFIEMGMLKFYD